MAQEPPSDEVIEKNKQDALRLANQLWNIVKKPEFIQLEYETRMKAVQEKVPEFSKAYPSVVRWMIRDLKYSNEAFRYYLDWLSGPQPTPEPGKGYLEYIRKQAEYGRILYKHSVPHFNVKHAAKIFQREYDAMLKTYKDMKKEEESIKSEFEEEKQVHHVQRIKEIVDFVKYVKSNQTNELNQVSKLNQVNLSTQTDQTEAIEKDKERIKKLIAARMQQAELLQKTGGNVPDLSTLTKPIVMEVPVVDTTQNNELTQNDESTQTELSEKELKEKEKLKIREEAELIRQEELKKTQEQIKLMNAASFVPENLKNTFIKTQPNKLRNRKNKNRNNKKY